MTIEELKAEAKAHGYNLVPIKNTEKLLPCTCGSRRREHWQRWRGEGWNITLQCMRCGKKAGGSTEDEARHNWNEMIRGAL